jgi:hypothetical protein
MGTAEVPRKQGLGVSGELLAHDAVKLHEPYAALGVAHGPVGCEAHKVRVRHVDGRPEVLLARARIEGRKGTLSKDVYQLAHSCSRDVEYRIQQIKQVQACKKDRAKRRNAMGN